MKSSGPSMGSCDLQMKTKPSEFKSRSVRHYGLQTTPNSLHDPHPPSNQQDFKDNIKCVPIKTDGACKTKKRVRKKVRFDYPPEDNHKQSDSTEVPHNFDKLYGAIRQGEKLDDGHISAACKILSKQFPDIQGLHTPVLGQNLSFPVVNSMYLLAGYEYIQILHTGADHWITVCIVSSDEVKVYDSMFHSTTYTTKKQIASILRTRSFCVKLQIGMTQFQENSVDCGVYAIAFATDLCHGNDPVQFKYDSPFKLRLYIC